MDFTRFPRRGYLQGETPIEPMENLGRTLDLGINFYVKRDDLLPGAAGGNKTRKLDFCIADALDQGADSIITCGAIQSNHCRLTASWSARENLECHLVLEERVTGSYRADASGNNFLYELLGVKSKRIVPGGSDMMVEMEKTKTSLEAEGKRPYIIPGGASNPIGALGYAACAEEMMNQLNQMQLRINHIVVPSGSAGTHAGLITGLFGTNSHIPLFGINVSRAKIDQEEVVYELAAETANLLDLQGALPRESVVCFDDYVGEGYSLPTRSMSEAVKLFAQTEAILLDPVYSGKAAAGLLDLARRGVFAEGDNVLFLHTGGSPALYAYLDTFRNEA